MTLDPIIAKIASHYGFSVSEQNNQFIIQEDYQGMRRPTFFWYGQGNDVEDFLDDIKDHFIEVGQSRTY